MHADTNLDNTTMAAMTFTIEVPDSVKLDRKALQEQLTAFAKILISYAPKVKKKEKEDMHIFDWYSGYWGGNRDSHEITDELYAGRENSHTVETLML